MPAKKEEKVMAKATLQQEKEADACRQKEDTTKTEAAKYTHQCAVVNTAADTFSGPNQMIIRTPPASVVSQSCY